ncbi:hypothetical protein M752DRAFT_313575 [Aspergillus phoenicis ATCC 13157]|uniref:Rhodopsin domain-containing protein n=1 Tax=Aspergillus phoenicis ATCC 13157 TaxID=1353007 RepID=A0A370PNF3_ASPPH|nr:hypothetical protein M752DRAFT_313575 [Aspergillus phoenicis ATCC 13157]
MRIMNIFMWTPRVDLHHVSGRSLSSCIAKLRRNFSWLFSIQSPKPVSACSLTGLSEHSFHLNVTFVSVTGVMTLLSTCLVALRFISRSLTLSIKLDDWFCLLALIFSYGLLCTTALVTTVGHAGIHITQYKDPLVLERYFQITLADMVIYNVSVGLTKISILLFYRRIFSINKTFLFCNWVVTGLSAGACIAAVSGLIFSSDPVDAQWKFWEPSTTIHNKSFWIAMGAVNILLDVTILILPQPVVWRLKQTRRCRIMLSLVFSLGGFVCVTSIVRLVYMATIDVTDLTCMCSPSFFGRPSTLTTPFFRQDTFTVPGIWTTAGVALHASAPFTVGSLALVFLAQFNTTQSTQDRNSTMTSKRQAPRGLAIIGVMWSKFMPTRNCGEFRILQTNYFLILNS